MADVKTIILEYICPGIGVVLATQMFLAPFPDVQKAIKSGSLGELNPLPWIFMFGNCTGWILYSYLTRNFFLFAGNITGLIVSIWFNLSASNLLFKQQIAQLPDVIKIVDVEEQSGQSGETEPEKSHELGDGTNLKDFHQNNGSSMSFIDENKSSHYKKMDDGNEDPTKGNETTPLTSPPITELPVFYKAPEHDYKVMAMALLWMVVFSVIGFGDSISPNSQQLIVGTVTNFCLVFFYGAPLSCIAIILRTHNTATLHVPTMFTNTASSLFWGIYGIAVMDFFVMVPNLIGAILGFTQITLYMIFPRVETTTVPVITAAVPAAGGMLGESSTEMEVVQLQLHDVGTQDLINTNVGDANHNPLAVEYAVPDVDGNDNNTDSNVRTLLKREISTNALQNIPSTENPLILQYAGDVRHEDDPEIGPPPPPSPISGGNNSDRIDENTAAPQAGVGLLHRRASSRNAGNIMAMMMDSHDPNAASSIRNTSAASSNPGQHATVSSVHHRRVMSNVGETSFLAGLFAGETDNVLTTKTTLHRRVKSAAAPSTSEREHRD